MFNSKANALAVSMACQKLELDLSRISGLLNPSPDATMRAREANLLSKASGCNKTTRIRLQQLSYAFDVLSRAERKKIVFSEMHDLSGKIETQEIVA